MITVKMLKQFLEKMPDDAYVTMKYENDNRFQDLSKVSLEEVQFKNDNGEEVSKNVVNLNFYDIADVLSELLYLDDEHYICSPSLLYHRIENKATSISDIFKFNFEDTRRPLCREGCDVSREINTSKPNIIDKILINELLLKLEQNMNEILDMYRDAKNKSQTYQSFRDKLRMLLFKE